MSYRNQKRLTQSRKLQVNQQKKFKLNREEQLQVFTQYYF